MGQPERNQKDRRAAQRPVINLLVLRCCLFVLAAGLASCVSSGRTIQPHINGLVAAQRYPQALEALGQDPNAYGARNQLLFWLDKGLVAHLAGQYDLSIRTFKLAERKFDELYTRSVSQGVGSWLVNDYAKDYAGSDHEYVLVSIFQMLNFAVLGRIDEALVEARKVDQKLKLITRRYPPDMTAVYQNDAFARWLSGLMWQVEGSPESLNDAYIAYSKAMELYPSPPEPLKDDWEQAKAFMERGQRPPANKAQVYVFEYTGYIPMKVADDLPLPVDWSHVAKISFPAYADRYQDVDSSLLVAQRGRQEFFKVMDVADDLGRTAKAILDQQRAWIMTKGVARPVMKTAVTKVAEAQVRDDLSAGLVNLFGNLYNFATEQADVRGWQTLPNQIRIGRLMLDPGTYDILVEDLDASKALLERRSLGRFELRAGETKFLVTRGGR